MLGPRDLVFSSVPVAHVPLLDRLAPVRAAGFNGISVSPADIWALEESGMAAETIRSRIIDHGLQLAEMDCIGYWLPSQQNMPANDDLAILLRSLTPERVLATAERIGARSVTIVEMLGATPSLDEAAEAFAGICDQAAEHGLIATIEFLPFGGIPDLTTAWPIVKQAARANGRLTIDSWHLFRSGSTLDQLEAVPGAYIGGVQINDAPLDPADETMIDGRPTRLLPGQGGLNLVGMIEVLDRIGSTAPIGVEVFSRMERNQKIEDIAHSWGDTARNVISKARGNS